MLTWQAHIGRVTSLAFVPGGGLLSTGSDGLKRWDTFGGTLQDDFHVGEATGPVSHEFADRVLVNATGSHAAVSVPNSMTSLRFIDLTGRNENHHCRLRNLHLLVSSPVATSVLAVASQLDQHDRIHPPGLSFLQISYPPVKVTLPLGSVPSSGRIAVNYSASEVLVETNRYKWPEYKLLPFQGPRVGGKDIVVSHDSEKLFSVAATRLNVWGYQTGAFRRVLKGHLDFITGLTSTPDGRKLWTASRDATVRQWGVETERCEKCYGLKIGPLGCVAVSPDGLTAAAGSSHNGMIAVWDLE